MGSADIISLLLLSILSYPNPNPNPILSNLQYVYVCILISLYLLGVSHLNETNRRSRRRRSSIVKAASRQSLGEEAIKVNKIGLEVVQSSGDPNIDGSFYSGKP